MYTWKVFCFYFCCWQNFFYYNFFFNSVVQTLDGRAFNPSQKSAEFFFRQSVLNFSNSSPMHLHFHANHVVSLEMEEFAALLSPFIAPCCLLPLVLRWLFECVVFNTNSLQVQKKSLKNCLVVAVKPAVSVPLYSTNILFLLTYFFPPLLY